jgi:hypothetical protein
VPNGRITVTKDGLKSERDVCPGVSEGTDGHSTVQNVGAVIGM